MDSNPKLNASNPKRSGPTWPVALALIAGVGLAHLWMLAAAPEQWVDMPGPTLNASALLYNASTATSPRPTPPRPGLNRPSGPQAGPQAGPQEASETGVTEPAAERASPSAPTAEPASAAPGPESSPAPAPAATIASLPASASASEPVPPGPAAVETPAATPARTNTPTTTPQAPAADPPPPEANATPAAPVAPTAPEAPAPAPAAAEPSPPASATPQPPEAPPSAQASAPPAAASSAAPVALSIPGPTRLNYQINGRARGFEYTASAQLDWQHDGQRYQSRVVISAFPLPSRSQTSVGEIGPQGLSPRRFSDRARTEVAIHFQPEQNRIVFSNNSPQAAWQAGTQDRLSVILQLSALLGGDPARFVPGAKISVPTAASREVVVWDFNVMRSENLSLPIGEHQALLLRREPLHPHDQTLELWFAPALGYLPVRLTISQANGDRLDQLLANIEKP